MVRFNSRYIVKFITDLANNANDLDTTRDSVFKTTRLDALKRHGETCRFRPPSPPILNTSLENRGPNTGHKKLRRLVKAT